MPALREFIGPAFSKLWSWLVLAMGFAIAVAFPLLFLGVEHWAIAAICLICAAILLLARPGGTVAQFMSAVFAYGLVFAAWCAAALVVVLVLSLLFSAPDPLVSILLVFVAGIVGVIRESRKASGAAISETSAN